MASAWLRRMSARSATERPSVPDHVFGDRRFGDLAAGGHNRDPYSRRPWIVPVHQGLFTGTRPRGMASELFGARQ